MAVQPALPGARQVEELFHDHDSSSTPGWAAHVRGSSTWFTNVLMSTELPNEEFIFTLLFSGHVFLYMFLCGNLNCENSGGETKSRSAGAKWALEQSSVTVECTLPRWRRLLSCGGGRRRDGRDSHSHLPFPPSRHAHARHHSVGCCFHPV